MALLGNTVKIDTSSAICVALSKCKNMEEEINQECDEFRAIGGSCIINSKPIFSKDSKYCSIKSLSAGMKRER